MKTHNMKLSFTDEGFCDDPYCSGHTKRELVCIDCGHRSAAHGYEDDRLIALEHKVDILLQAAENRKPTREY